MVAISPRFHELLEAVKFVANLLFGFFAEELCDRSSQYTPWRLVLHHHLDLSAPIPRRRLKPNKTGVLNGGIVYRSSGN